MHFKANIEDILNAVFVTMSYTKDKSALSSRIMFTQSCTITEQAQSLTEYSDWTVVSRRLIVTGHLLTSA